MGSGSLAAMAVFESSWKPNMSVSHQRSTLFYKLTNPWQKREDALALVTSAISAGIFNDLGSGSNVDACVITATHTEMLRNYVKPNERAEKELHYRFRRGTTAWKSERVRDLIVDEQITHLPPAVSAGGDAMDTS